ncbi:hypothetical protein NKH77_05090 [Streptomyces sp. M19]
MAWQAPDAGPGLRPGPSRRDLLRWTGATAVALGAAGWAAPGAAARTRAAADALRPRHPDRPLAVPVRLAARGHPQRRLAQLLDGPHHRPVRHRPRRRHPYVFAGARGCRTGPPSRP